MIIKEEFRLQTKGLWDLLHTVEIELFLQKERPLTLLLKSLLVLLC